MAVALGMHTTTTTHHAAIGAVTEALHAMEAATKVNTPDDTASMLLDVVRDHLDTVLADVETGGYLPTIPDAIAALEFARNTAPALGWTAKELAPLINVAARAITQVLAPSPQRHA